MSDITRREMLAILAMMTMRPIPSSTEKLPLIGLGTWQVNVTDDLIRTFIELGGRLIDSSPMYGPAEQMVGDVITRLGVRSKLFIATKVWTTGKSAGIRQMEQSEQKMRARPIDLMQVHNLLDVETHLDTLDAWKREGRVRYIGITHYTSSAHEAVARILERRKVDFVQIDYSVAERDAERRVLPVARERGVAVIANRPFASGELFSRLRSQPLPAWAKEIDCTSWAQVLLKFVVSNPVITCAIPATSNVNHLRDNMAAGSGRMPDDALRKRIVTAVI